MIERVARAIRAVVSDDYEDLSDPVKRMFKEEARAAIEAMRELTEPEKFSVRGFGPQVVNEAWVWVIDAALKKEKAE